METLRFRVVAAAENSRELAFHLVAETDEILLMGGGFVDREACVAGIQAVIDVVSDEERYIAREESDSAVLTLTAPDNRLLAQSVRLRDQTAALALRDSLTELASEQEEYDIALPGTQSGRTVTALSFREGAAVDPADLYDFARSSATGQAGFEPLQIAGEERFYFHVNDASGLALLYSREFRAVSQRNQRMRMVAKSGVLKQRYERRSEDGRFFFFLKARNGQEIARSRAFASSEEREASLSWLLLEMTQMGEIFIRRSKARARRKDGFNLALASLAAAAGFELLRDAADKLHYFIFHALDGTALIVSQGYATRAGRDKAIQTLIRLSANPARYETARTKQGHAFAIRARNNQLIAHSREYDDALAAGAAMTLAQAQIVTYAAAFGVAPEELESAREEQLTLYADRERPDAPVAALMDVAGVPAVLDIPDVSFVSGVSNAAVSDVGVETVMPLERVAAVEGVAPDTTRTNAALDMSQTGDSDARIAPLPVSVSAELPVAASAAVITPQPHDESAAASASAAHGTAATMPPATAKDARPPADTSRRKIGGYVWLAGALILILLLFALPPFLHRGRQDGAGNPAQTAAPGRARSGAGIAAIPPPPAGQGRSALPPPLAAHRESARVAAADTPALSQNRASSSADNAGGAVVHQGHSRSEVMETALAAYLSGPPSAEPRAFTMDRLAYPPNSHEVNAAGKEEIRDLAHVLTKFPKVRIVLHGHLDGTEKEAYFGPNPRLGYPLSKLRPDCVCRRLHFLGISYDRMQIAGEGSAQPTGDDSTAQGRQQNRRIDITVDPAH